MIQQREEEKKNEMFIYEKNKQHKMDRKTRRNNQKKLSFGETECVKY